MASRTGNSRPNIQLGFRNQQWRIHNGLRIYSFFEFWSKVVQNFAKCTNPVSETVGIKNTLIRIIPGQFSSIPSALIKVKHPYKLDLTKAAMYYDIDIEQPKFWSSKTQSVMGW
jgi:hypothetical protein